MNEQQYIKAFNQGYVLSKHKPEFIEIVKASPDSSVDYFQAILAGAKQYEKDMAKEKFKTTDVNKSHDKDSNSPDKGIGRDHD